MAFKDNVGSLDRIAAALESMSGGGGTGLVIPTYTTTNMSTFTCDMTYSEIESAISDGKCIACRICLSNGDEDIYGIFVLKNAGNGIINYGSSGLIKTNDEYSVAQSLLAHESNGTITFSSDQADIGGGGGGGDTELVKIGATYDDGTELITLQKTGNEILALVEQGKVPYYEITELDVIERLIMYANSGEMIAFMFGFSIFSCETLSDYPEQQP